MTEVNTKLMPINAALIGVKNEQFASMSPAEKRVAIAKDVLETIRTNAIIPMSGTYIDVMYAKEFQNPKFSALVGVQETLGRAVECSVCAVGSMMISKCRINGDSKVISSSHWSGSCNSQHLLYEDLGQYFDNQQLALIESAFERDSGFCSDHVNDEEPDEKVCKELMELATRAEDFGFAYEDDSDRLKAIMQNIVDNQGTFNPVLQEA